MMRVLFWSPAFWPELGGVQTFGVQLIRALRVRGYEFRVVTGQYAASVPSYEMFEGVSVHRFPFRNLLSSGRIDDVMDVSRQVAELKRSFVPDVVHLNDVGVGTFFHLTTSNAISAPTLLTLHGLWPGQTDARDSVAIRAIQAADWIACCSHATLQDARLLVPEISARSTVIHNARKAPDRAPSALPVTGQRLLYLGRLSREKGVDLALRAFAKIAPRFAGTRLLIAGGGPEREALERQAIESGMSDRVDFLGWVEPERVSELLNSVSMVLIPSRWEGFGLGALEAALMARPVVAARVGGLPEVVKDRVTGILVPVDDADALAAAVETLLTRPDEARRMGNAARKHAIETFNLQEKIEAYDSLYRNLTATWTGDQSEQAFAPGGIDGSANHDQGGTSSRRV
ncbi:MAG TPA: glycosyltransferase family 4 protein [Rhodothermales bacterium]|nr:glycosyltransferase family 4 protein [Rhodothermales bacterium]